MDPVLAEFVARARGRLGDRLVKVSLFGSRARGTHRPSSDYDLLVVVRGDRQVARESISWVDLDLLLERAANVSPKVVTEDQYRELSAGASAFWSRFRREEVALWPTSPSQQP